MLVVIEDEKNTHLAKPTGVETGTHPCGVFPSRSMPPHQRFLLLLLICCLSGAGCAPGDQPTVPARHRPNIVLLMSDDQGWADVGYRGHPFLQTPNLDEMAAGGVQFDRFYAASPVCSPTRASCLTGRHPSRYEIHTANSGHLKRQEPNLAQILREQGYTTGHFGKWHLGTLTRDELDANRGGRTGGVHYAPPWEHGFDVSFSTESKVPTWDPMVTPGPEAGDIGNRTPGDHFGTYYWSGPGLKETSDLEGDDSRILMDRAIDFIQTATLEGRQFLAVVWFHAPHLPVLTGSRYRRPYSDLSPDQQHYYGTLTAMDHQVGRLRATLRDLGVAHNTMVWFASDNGPEGKSVQNRTQGSAGHLRGRKRSLYEGGVRVPAILEWPNVVQTHRRIELPATTLDYLPTILDLLDLTPPIRPVDGVSLLPLIRGQAQMKRPLIPFLFRDQMALTGMRYKLYSADAGQTFQLYDLIEDPSESHDLSDSQPEKVDTLRRLLLQWLDSVKASAEGADYASHAGR